MNKQDSGSVEIEDLNDVDFTISEDAGFWYSTKAFLDVSWTIRKRDTSFLFICLISIFVAVINLNVDYGGFSVIGDKPSPEIVSDFNGTYMINASMMMSNKVFRLGISPNNSITSDLAEKYPFIRPYTFFDTVELMASHLDQTIDAGVGFGVEEFSIKNSTKSRVVANSFDTVIGINAISEMLLSKTDTNYSQFEIKHMGFPHPPLNSEVDMDSITTLYVYISFMIVSIRAIQFFFTLGKDKVLFMCHLNRLSDFVQYTTVLIIGLVDHIPITIVVTLSVSLFTKSTSGSNILIVFCMFLLFVIGFWLMVFAFGSLPRSDGTFAVFIISMIVIEIATVMLFLFKQFIPFYVIKIVMILFPNGGLHAGMLLFTKVKSFYGPISFSNIKSEYYFSILEIFLYQLGNIGIGFFFLVLFGLCAPRFYGVAPLGWKNLFSLIHWKKLFSKTISNRVSNSGESAISFNELRKTYQGEAEIVALKSLSEEIKKNEVIILIGPNGSGKSTLINCLTGATSLDSGVISLYGEPIQEDYSELYQCLGFVAQDNILFKELTVEEHLRFFARIRGIREPALELNVEYFSHILQLTKQLHSRSEGLSGGEKRKLCIAIAMIQRPQILVLDEPTSGVDVQSRQIIWRTLESMKNTTSFISTHALEEAESVCSRIFVLKSGEIVFSGTPVHLREQTHCGYVLRAIDGKDEGLLSLVQQIVPEATIDNEGRSGIFFPIDERATQVINLIEEKMNEYGISEYTVHVENLEENLIRFVEEAEV